MGLGMTLTLDDTMTDMEPKIGSEPHSRLGPRVTRSLLLEIENLPTETIQCCDNLATHV